MLTTPLFTSLIVATMSSNLRVVLGCGEFGRGKLAADEECFSIVDAFLSAGYKETDSALMYGNGAADQTLGRYVTANGLSSKISLCIKVNPWISNDLRRETVLEQANTSLKYLQVPRVDILYLHAPDHSTPIEETLGACQELYQEGKFKELGMCNYASWEVVDAYHICKRNGWVLPTVYQGMYNAITRKVESELFPALRHFGMRFNAYNPLACGLLTGKWHFTDIEKDGDKQGRFFVDPKFSKLYQERYWRKTAFEGIDLVRQALEEAYGGSSGKVSLARAALRWLNHHSKLQSESGDGIVIGGSALSHVEENIAACSEGPLDPRVVKAFDEAWNMDKQYCVNYFR